MQSFILAIAFCTLSVLAFSQSSSKEFSQLKKLEEEHKELARSMVLAEKAEDRIKAVHSFIPKLVDMLKTKNSFYYSFDSLQMLSIIKDQANTFRIITWEVTQEVGTSRHYGVIQYNDKNFRLTPLFDYSDTFSYRSNLITSPSNWIGCIYYNMIEKTIEGKRYYVLFGYDRKDLWTSRKLLEVLTFDENKVPVFGSPIFNVSDTLGQPRFKNRFYIDYKYDVNSTLNFDTSRNLIIYDHLIPMKDEYESLHFTYVPDGSYEGFKFENGMFNWVRKVFKFAIEGNDNPPLPHPVLNDRD